MPRLIELAKDSEIKEIYYVNIKDIRNEQIINDAYEKKRNRLLEKLNEYVELQKKRINEDIEHERKNMIKEFREDKKFIELRKKLNMRDLSPRGQEGTNEFNENNASEENNQK